MTIYDKHSPEPTPLGGYSGKPLVVPSEFSLSTKAQTLFENALKEHRKTLDLLEDGDVDVINNLPYPYTVSYVDKEDI